MKVWLDNVRTPPRQMERHLQGAYYEACDWVWCKTAAKAIDLLSSGGVTHISLDHDLGDEANGTGYDVACFIEDGAFRGSMEPLEWAIHSQNPVGRQRMKSALVMANMYWRNRQIVASSL